MRKSNKLLEFVEVKSTKLPDTLKRNLIEKQNPEHWFQIIFDEFLIELSVCSSTKILSTIPAVCDIAATTRLYRQSCALVLTCRTSDFIV